LNEKKKYVEKNSKLNKEITKLFDDNGMLKKVVGE
jgi:hypothetical protein